ncbi:MAG: ABC transporter ATP-binding protein, partial [Actinobacteria bacterium]|nr:ABC transporter ATP-binding protein [Actinomycetota bacterium]
MARISIKNVTKYYGKDLILNNISLDIKDKEFFCITGPSGGGKTTLLKIVAGLDTNHTGRVYMDDVDITYLSPAERNIAMVFQEYA